MKGQNACFSAASCFTTVNSPGSKWPAVHSFKAADVEVSLVTASAQLPERTEVREESEHCRGQEWQVSQAISTEFIQAA